MPILKGASSDFTQFVKSNAQAFPAGTQAPKVVKTTVSPVNASITSSVTKATAVAAKVSPVTAVVTSPTITSKTKSTR